MEVRKINNFSDLVVWQKGHQLVLVVYKLTKLFPPEEKFGIISQIQRAVTSITANIAEGYERYHFKDKIKFYYYSRGSLAEVQNFLFVAKDLKIITERDFEEAFEKTNEVRKLINGLIKSIGNKL